MILLSSSLPIVNRSFVTITETGRCNNIISSSSKESKLVVQMVPVNNSQKALYVAPGCIFPKCNSFIKNSTSFVREYKSS